MLQSRPKIVVTGAAGFIGSHLVDRLLADTDGDVVGLDNFTRGRAINLAHLSNEPRFTLIEGDVRDAAVVSDLMRDATLVFHLAAQSTVMGAVRDMDYTFQTNVVGTFNVISAAARQGVERVLFASSREVYGEPISLPVDEETPLMAINSYGASKLAGEAYCRVFRREFGLNTVVLRLANVYGPRDIGRVVPLWLNAANEGEDLYVYGGKQVIDFVFVGQVVEAFMRASVIARPLPPINIGSGTGTRIVDLARRLVRLADSRSKVRLYPARPTEVTRFIANTERMRQILLIEPPLDPLSSLAEMYAEPVGAVK